jgi:hypothetical protein
MTSYYDMIICFKMFLNVSATPGTFYIDAVVATTTSFTTIAGGTIAATAPLNSWTNCSTVGNVI